MLKKIAFLGSVGSGKTTIVRRLSEGDTLDTDVKSSIDIGKDTTTVGIDYGHISINETTRLGLYGIPGQRKFSLIWDHVKEGLWAVVILVKNDDHESVQELEYLIEYFEVTEKTPLVVGVTYADIGDPQKTIDSIRKRLNQYGLDGPIFTIDPRKESSAILIMETLIALEENE